MSRINAFLNKFHKALQFKNDLPLCLALTYKTISFVIVCRKQFKENTEHSNYIRIAPFSSRNI